MSEPPRNEFAGSSSIGIPEQARKELAALADEDPILFERLEDRIGNPPDPVRVVNVVAERPEWLVGARPWRALA